MDTEAQPHEEEVVEGMKDGSDGPNPLDIEELMKELHGNMAPQPTEDTDEKQVQEEDEVYECQRQRTCRFVSDEKLTLLDRSCDNCGHSASFSRVL